MLDNGVMAITPGDQDERLTALLLCKTVLKLGIPRLNKFVSHSLYRVQRKSSPLGFCRFFRNGIIAYNFIYTVSGKKEATLFSSTTFAFFGRFL